MDITVIKDNRSSNAAARDTLIQNTLAKVDADFAN